MSEAIEALRAAQAGYEPSQEVSSALSDVTMVPIIGPVAVGKSTTMNAVCILDSEFGRVQSFTTRGIRAGEARDEYRWHDGSEEGLGQIRDAVEAGELVQYVVHPTTDVVYGSDLSDFGEPYAMLDALSTSIPPLRALPFKKMVEITLVADLYMWQLSFKQRRAQVDGAELYKRLQEGRRSLIWSLDQGDDMAWVENHFGKRERAAQDIIAIAKGTGEPDPSARYTGEQLLMNISRLLDE